MKCSILITIVIVFTVSIAFGEMVITPEEIFLRTLPGDTVSEILTVVNSGESPLEITITPDLPEIVDPYVLIFQENIPWNNSHQEYLGDIGVQFDVFGMEDMDDFSLEDLNIYTVIMIPSIQDQNFYDTFELYYDIYSEWVSNGGWLEFHGCTEGATWSLFDGIPTYVHSSSETNYVVEPDHPICAGIPEEFTGTSANNGYMMDIPDNATTLIVDPENYPVLVEYSFGLGKVIITTETWEYGVGENQVTGDIMYNCIDYTSSHAMGANTWLYIDPINSIIQPGDFLEISVVGSALNEDIIEGLYETILTITADDPGVPEVEVPVTFIVGGRWINGIVMDVFDEPMEYAFVSFEEYAEYRTRTYDNGNYSLLHFLPPGNHDVICEYPDYWTSEYENFEITDADTMTLNFSNESGLPMVYPEGEVETTELLIFVDDDSTGTESFLIQSVGTGRLEWEAWVYDIVTFYSTHSSMHNPGVSSDGIIGPVAELDDTWDLLEQFDVQTVTGNDGIVAAVCSADSIYVSARYIDEENGGNILYALDRQGNLSSTYSYPEIMLDSAGYGFNDLAFSPTTNELFGANADGDIFRFTPDFSDYSLVMNVPFSPNAVAYDLDEQFVYLRESDSNFAVVDAVSGQYTQLAIEPEQYSVTGMAYMPMDVDGYTIWLAAHDGNGQGGFIFRYNPVTLEYDVTATEIYPPEENSVISGMDIGTGWRDDFYDITTVHKGAIDYVDIWEGKVKLLDWIWLEPTEGVIQAGGGMNVSVNADLRLAEDIFDLIDCGAGCVLPEIWTEIRFRGQHWDNTPVVNVIVYLPISTNEEIDRLPTEYTLHQSYPNPFNPVTSIKFDLVAAQNVKLSVYNILGQEVAQLVNGRIEAGFHHISFEADHLASGVYFYSIETDAFSDIKKMIMVK